MDGDQPPASLCLSSPCLALESGKAHWTTINCITSLDGLEISTEMHLYWKALDWNVSVNMALCSVVFSPFSPFSAGSHPLELAPPPPQCSRETNLHFHLHTTRQRTIRTWMSLSLHRRRECLVWRMTSIWGAEHGSLSTKLHFPATGLSLSRKWTICGRGGGWSLLSKKPFSAVLSQLRKLYPFPRSQSPIHQENSTKKTWNYLNYGTSQSILINFFVTMDRPAGWLHHRSVAIREAKKTKHCEFFWHSPTATIPTASACTRNICTTPSSQTQMREWPNWLQCCAN